MTERMKKVSSTSTNKGPSSPNAKAKNYLITEKVGPNSDKAKHNPLIKPSFSAIITHKSAMHINVQDILAEDLGYNRTYSIAGEQPALEGITLTGPLEGEIRISRLDDGILVEGRMDTKIELECHRCLSTFTRPMGVSLKQIYSIKPQDDNLPIEHNEIDLVPLITQELLVSLPIKILCQVDCPGLATEINV
jgi:uncharacterized metal-binding protein YceD (DUF177 family)